MAMVRREDAKIRKRTAPTRTFSWLHGRGRRHTASRTLVPIVGIEARLLVLILLTRLRGIVPMHGFHSGAFCLGIYVRRFRGLLLFLRCDRANAQEQCGRDTYGH